MGNPEYDWMQAKRILSYKVPYSRRKITYIDLYIMTLNQVESNKTPAGGNIETLCRGADAYFERVMALKMQLFMARNTFAEEVFCGLGCNSPARWQNYRSG